MGLEKEPLPSCKICHAPLESVLFSGVWLPPLESWYVLEDDNGETICLKNAVSTLESTS